MGFFNRKNRIINKQAFTLIELLIVIAIIGILASVVMVKLADGRAKARDAQRMSDFAQIGKALDMYKAINGAYPLALVWDTGDSTNWQVLKNALEPTYFSQVPQDPRFDSTYPRFGYVYHYYSTGSAWTLMVKNETLRFANKCGQAYDGWGPNAYWLIFCSH